MKKITKTLFTALAVFCLSYVFVVVAGDWNPPSYNPPGGQDSIPTPITIGDGGEQEKTGAFAVGGTVLVDKEVVIKTTGGRPSCDSNHPNNRGLIWLNQGTEDEMSYCQKKSDGTYAWRSF